MNKEGSGLNNTGITDGDKRYSERVLKTARRPVKEEDPNTGYVKGKYTRSAAGMAPPRLDVHKVFMAMIDEGASNESRHDAVMLMALVEIREAIDDGLMRLDQTCVETLAVLSYGQGNLEKFIDARIKSDKVIYAVLAEIAAVGGRVAAQGSALATVIAGKAPDWTDRPETPEPLDEPAPESEKSEKKAVTLSDGDFGQLGSDRG